MKAPGITFYCRDCGLSGTALRVDGSGKRPDLPEACIDCGGKIVEPGAEDDLSDWAPFAINPASGIMNDHGRMN